MACSSPLTVQNKLGMEFLVSCKQCLPCRIAKQSSLTLRCLLEHQLASSASFLTLTYREDPGRGTYSDMQKFLKRLRTSVKRNTTSTDPIRYLACGEYGGKTGRFHFHALIWNAPDRFLRDQLTTLWPFGFVHCGDVNRASIRYTARYTLKFQEKGEAATAGWSKSPPLGFDGMLLVGAGYRQQRHVLSEIPVSATVEGSSYALDDAMKRAFALGYGSPLWQNGSLLARRAVSYRDQLLERIVTAKSRSAIEQKRYFWEDVKVGYETF